MNLWLWFIWSLQLWFTLAIYTAVAFHLWKVKTTRYFNERDRRNGDGILQSRDRTQHPATGVPH
jgi:hypothetical protein